MAGPGAHAAPAGVTGRPTPAGVARLARSVRRLDGSQVVHRVRLRGQRQLDARGGGARPWRRLAGAPAPTLRALAPVSREAGLHDAAEAHAVVDGTLVVQGQALDGHLDWDPPWPRLALMHLHYADWLHAFAAHPDRAWAQDRVVAVVRHWAAAVRPGAWMPWHPYVVACRGWNLAAVLPGLLDDVPEDLARLVWFHGDQLRRNLELDVRGNHLVRDLRGLVALGLACGEPSWVDDGVAGLERAVAEQVLADGGHHERSPYYHVQVLVDLAEVCDLLDLERGSAPPVLVAATDAMRSWLGAVQVDTGRLPVVNDGLPVAARRDEVPTVGPGLVDLAPSGYAVARRGPWWAMVDVGTPAPRTLPAHGHCSLLALELAHRGQPLLVNTGSSTYDDPAVRAAERGTLAHNTVQVDGAEPSEVWDRFRMGRQAEPVGVEVRPGGPEHVVAAGHDGYRRLPGAPAHRRTVAVADDLVRVVDVVHGGGQHRAVGVWRLAPGRAVAPAGPGRVLVDDELVLEVRGADEVELVPAAAPGAAWVALDYGHRQAVPSLRWQAAGSAVTVTTEVRPVG